MQKKKHEALMCLGRAIRSKREERGFSQEVLALESEVNRTYMGCLERGEENVSLLTLGKICKVLDVKISELLLKARL